MLGNFADATDGPEIPLCTGLRIVTAISQSDGDYESIKTVESADASGLRIKYASERMYADILSSDPPVLQKTTVYRQVLRPDLGTAKLYLQQFSPLIPEAIPETTALGTSRAVLEALKKTGEAELGIFIAYSSEASIDRNTHPNVYDNQMVARVRRVGEATVEVPVIVNDEAVMLPTVHAEGDFFGDKTEFFFLDDPDNPLTLKYRFGIGSYAPMEGYIREHCLTMLESDPEVGKQMCPYLDGGDIDTLQVIKIDFRCTADEQTVSSAPGGGTDRVPDGDELSAGIGGTSIEQALAETGRADVYSIYFSFNSAELREESEDTLQEIASLMSKYPQWRLNVEGHTDNVASDRYNQELSAKRAAAVRNALIERYAVDGARLLSSGAGESRPVDTNDTLEGRARNRRVELIRR